MTTNELKAKFPNASASFLAVAATDAPDANTPAMETREIQSPCAKWPHSDYTVAAHGSKLHFIVAGKPQGKQRARSTKSGHHFTPKKTVHYEAAIREAAIAAMRREVWDIATLAVAPVKVSIVAAFEMPKSWSEKKRLEMFGNPHTQKPDGDNIAKAVCDGLNGACIWHDDAQVSDLSIIKRWADGTSGISVTVEKAG